MIFPEISILTAGIIVILQALLMLNVGLGRGKSGVGIGDGGDEELARKIRVHGNLAENAALFIAALALIEVGGAPTMLVMILGGVFVIARFSHAIGLSKTTGVHPLRAVGAIGTILCLLVAGGTALWLGLNMF